jgi:D-amino-acid oxidase
MTSFFYSRTFLHIITLVICTSSFAAGDVEIRYLQPPRLQQHNWGDRIVCHRPVRCGSPRMEVEFTGMQFIVHNYGFGGSGWTLAPGCAQYMVQQFLDDLYPMRRDEPITIIGAGVIGLFTAYELVKDGFTNITIIADQFDDLVSHRAGGFLAPSTMDVPAHMQDTINDICFDAYCFYTTIARGEHEDFPRSGATIMPIYLKRYDTRLAAYEGVVMNAPHDVVIDFGNGKRYDMKVYDDGIFMDTNVMMCSLKKFLDGKVTWVNNHVTSCDEIDAFYVFNCAGLGAGQLCDDKAVFPAQGHLILLKDQQAEDMNYMISFYVDPGITEDGLPVKRSIYMFPKHVLGTPQDAIGVMGGTFIDGATHETPNHNEFDLLIERAQEFFGA